MGIDFRNKIGQEIGYTRRKRDEINRRTKSFSDC